MLLLFLMVVEKRIRFKTRQHATLFFDKKIPPPQVVT
uniref:Uncharacterized protein n=1 Tax=Lepeophtheirus salmonis TaxID=72036 RepID=A0A0K2V3C9_LEPSM